MLFWTVLLKKSLAEAENTVQRLRQPHVQQQRMRTTLRSRHVLCHYLIGHQVYNSALRRALPLCFDDGMRDSTGRNKISPDKTTIHRACQSTYLTKQAAGGWGEIEATGMVSEN